MLRTLGSWCGTFLIAESVTGLGWAGEPSSRGVCGGPSGLHPLTPAASPCYARNVPIIAQCALGTKLPQLGTAAVDTMERSAWALKRGVQQILICQIIGGINVYSFSVLKNAQENVSKL